LPGSLIAVAAVSVRIDEARRPKAQLTGVMHSNAWQTISIFKKNGCCPKG
jgi:hypothetical protein